MTFKGFRWLKALWPTRRSSRLHPIDDGVTKVRNFITVNSFNMEIDDGPIPFPVVAISSNHVQKMRSACLKGKDCSICLEDFETSNDHRVVPLPCAHFFHTMCISKWFEMSSKLQCPLCGSTIKNPPPSSN